MNPVIEDNKTLVYAYFIILGLGLMLSFLMSCVE